MLRGAATTHPAVYEEFMVTTPQALWHHSQLHNHLLGRAENFVSSVLRIKVGFFEHFFSTEPLGL